MLTHQLSADTQAILLLCAHFGQNRTDPKPLNLHEYNTLAHSLRSQQLTPKNLLEKNTQEQLSEMSIPLATHRIIDLLERGMMLSLAVEKWTRQGLWILSRSDPQYPRRLKQKLQHLAPAILYGVGNFERLSQGGLAVVGSRNVDEEGVSYTDYIVQACAQQGIQIISGGARGVDQTAMLGALNGGGTVLGILPDSLAKSAVSSKYCHFIKSGNLTLISASDPDAGFSVGNAMGRNKYIYGLSDYGLVISSAFAQGGTWNGAIEALEKIKGVPVLVRIQGTLPEGNQELIHRGAKPFPEIPFNRPIKELINNVIMADIESSTLVNTLPISPSEINLPSASEDQKVIEKLPFSDEIKVDETTEIHQDYPMADQIKLVGENAEISHDSTLSEQTKSVSKEREISQDEKISPTPKTIYEAVLPLILAQLKEPKKEKDLAELLEVKPGQMRDWLNIAVNEGKVKKNKKPVTYQLNEDISLLNLCSDQR